MEGGQVGADEESLGRLQMVVGLHSGRLKQQVACQFSRYHQKFVRTLSIGEGHSQVLEGWTAPEGCWEPWEKSQGSGQEGWS